MQVSPSIVTCGRHKSHARHILGWHSSGSELSQVQLVQLAQLAAEGGLRGLTGDLGHQSIRSNKAWWCRAILLNAGHAVT